MAEITVQKERVRLHIKAHFTQCIPDLPRERVEAWVYKAVAELCKRMTLKELRCWLLALELREKAHQAAAESLISKPQ